MLESDSDADMSGEELPASVADEEEQDDEEEEVGSDPEEAEVWKVRDPPPRLSLNCDVLTRIGNESQYARRRRRPWS